MNKSAHPLFRNTGVIILAGGKSERMGYPKPFLEVNGTTLLETIHGEYEPFTGKIEVVLNSQFCDGSWKTTCDALNRKMRIQLNDHPGRGRFYSLRLGLPGMTGKAFCFLQNVDTPVSQEVILALAAAKNPAGYTVPVCEGRSGHPILISRTIMNAILLAGPGEIILSEFLKQFPRREVRVEDPGIFLNLNTEEAYRDYLQLRVT